MCVFHITASISLCIVHLSTRLRLRKNPGAIEAPQGHLIGPSHAYEPSLDPHLAQKSLLSETLPLHTSIHLRGSTKIPFLQSVAICLLTMLWHSSVVSFSKSFLSTLGHVMASSGQWGNTLALDTKLVRHFLHLYTVSRRTTVVQGLNLY